ncbi:glycine cleavage system protein P-like pyridoxal-binding family [Mucilaginibacter lappiensis]|uniref:Glycine cleavage system protein P-like pyridoxal-binding family n=1 Tax=Mucilaginibacter lappiensis TaxID=354630 RepID=A0A841JBN8_9SPHI|nr:glycine cleavage system protein P-like pyridoxal-binding family [Mucilaginibacter lappiensis]
MLAKETLIELKLNMPYKYVRIIISAYKKQYDTNISRWMAMRFFKEDGYSNKLHNTIINAAFIQQKLKNRTDCLKRNHVYKINVLQYYRERKGLIQ